MTYEAWRISFQSGEQAARSAYMEAETLRAKVAEQEAEIEQLRYNLQEAISAVRALSAGQPFNEIVIADAVKRTKNRFSEQLTTTQAQIEQLREALEHFALIDLGRTTLPGSFSTDVLAARKALSISSPLDALREHDARLAQKMFEKVFASGKADSMNEALMLALDQIRKGEF